MRKLPRCLAAVAVILLSIPALLVAQQRPAGVVTTLQGTAELTRPTQPLPASLHFKDAIFVRDVINTKEKSLARVLFGGKSTVTVRELSRLEVREENLPGGATRSIHELSSGAILVNVAKQLMRPGDEVQIRTPNAVAAVRGTILYVDCPPARTNPTCNFTVLTGDVTLTPQGRPSVNLPANSTATVTGSPATGIQVSPVTAIAPTQVTHILQQFDVQVALTQEVNRQQIAAAQVEQASQLARAVVATITGIDPGPTPTTATTTQSQQSTSSGDQKTSQDQQAAQEEAQAIQTALVSTSEASPSGSNTPSPIGSSTAGSVVTAPITPVLPPPPPPVNDLIINSGDLFDFSTGTPATFDTITQTGGTLTGTDTVSSTTLYNWSGGTQSGNGSTNIPSGATLTINGSPATLDTRTLNNAGTANLTSGSLLLNNAALFNNSGTFNAQDGTQISSDAGVPGTFSNGGTFTRSGNGATGVSVPFNNTNSGSVQINGGTLTLSGGGTGSGSFSGAGTLDIAGNYTFAPSSNVTTSNVIFDSGTSSVQGTYNLAGSSTTVNGGTADFTGTLGNVGAIAVSGGTANFSSGEAIAPTSLTQSGGTLTGSDTVNLSGGLNNWAGGTMGGSGPTNVLVGGTLNINGATETLDTRTLHNSGTVNFSGGSLVINNGAAVNNSGSFNAQGATTIGSSGGTTGTVNNSGTFAKSGAGTTTTVSVPFNNTSTGTVNVSSGTLSLTGSETNGGTENVASGATLSLASAGPHTGTFNVSGALNLLGGLVSAASGQTLNPTGTMLNVNGGTITANGATPLYNLTGGILNVLGSTNFLLSMSGGSATLGGRLIGLSGASSATINSLFTLSGNSSLALGTDLANVAGGSSLTVTGSSLGSFGNGTNSLSFTNAPLCSTGTCVPINATGFNILLTNGAVISNVSIDPTFAGFSGLGGTNSVAGVASNQAIIVVDGATSTLALGSNALPNLVITSGTTDFSSGSNPSFSSVNISGGTLTGSDTVTVVGSTAWSGGTMSGTGIANANGGMDISGFSTKTLDTRTLNNAGVANLSGGSLTIVNGATLNSTGAFNNTATLDVQSGTADLHGGGTDTGTFNAASGSAVNFTGGTHDLNTGAALTGAGNVNVSAGAVDLNASGIDRLTGTLNIAGGSLNVTGDLMHLQSGALNPTGTMVRSIGGMVNVNSQDVNTLLATPNLGGQPANSIAMITNEKATVGTLEWAYIPVSSAGQVNVIDANTNAVIKTIAVGAGTNPSVVAATPDQDRIFVLNPGSTGVAASVSIIDVHPVGAAAANNVVATLAVGNEPNTVVFTPDSSKAFITNSQSGTVTVIDNSTNPPVIITTLTVGTNPKGASVTPDGTKLYVANAGSNSVSVINTSTNAVITTVNVGTQPIGLAVSPDGTKVGVVNNGSNNVSVIDVATNGVTNIAVGTTPSGGAITPNGKFAYVSNQASGTVSVINMATNTRIDADPLTPGVQDIQVGTNPSSVVISSDSRRVYVANEGSNSVSVIDTATNKVVGTINFGSAPLALALSRETADLFNLFVVNQGSNDVSVVHVADTSDLIEVAGGSTVAVGNSTGTPALSFGDTTSSTAVNTAGTLLRVRDAGSSLSVQGPILSGTNTTFNVDRGFLRVNNGGSLFYTGPASSTALFSLSGSTPAASTVNTVANLFALLDSNSSLVTAAPLFSATNTDFTLGPNLRDASTFLSIEEGATVVSTGTSPFITLSGSNIFRSNDFFTLRRSPDNVAPAAAMFLSGALAEITNSSITTNRSFFQVLEQAALVQLGSATTPLINTANSIFNIGDPALGTATNDFVLLGDNTGGVSFQGPATVILSGPLLIDAGSQFNGVQTLLGVSNGSSLGSTTPNPLIQLSSSRVTESSNVISMGSNHGASGSAMTLGGSLLSATNGTTFNPSSPAVTNSFMFVGDSSILNGPPKPAVGDAPALLNFTDSAVCPSPCASPTTFFATRRSLINPTQVNLGGALLSAQGSNFNNSTFISVQESAQLTGTGTGALVQTTTTPSTIATTGNFMTVNDLNTGNSPGTAGPANVSLAGGILSDTSGSTFNIGSQFLSLTIPGGTSGSTLTSTSPDAAYTFNNSTANAGSNFAQISGANSKVTLSGSLVSATGGALNVGTDPTVSGDVLDVNTGGQLVMNSGNPVLSLSGGSLTVGTADTTTNNTANRVVRLLGVNTATDASGTFGTDLTIKGNGTSFTVPDPFTGGTATAANPIGSLLEATGGANIQVQKGLTDGSSAAIRIDTALFEATAPIINLVGSLTGQTQLTIGAATDAANANRALDLNSASVMSRGPVIALDKGLISVNNGPLVNLTGSKMLVDANGVAMIMLANGSQINVADLFRLNTASKINVVNGPLVLVDGAGSTLNASGALATFVGAGGGNQIVVNNNILPNEANPTTTAGIPVNGTNITIGAVAGGTTPVRNSGLGTISVNGVAVGSASPNFTGSLVQTTNGGTVKICTKAGGC